MDKKERLASDEEFDRLVCTPRFTALVRKVVKASKEGKFDIDKVTRRVTF